MRWKALLLAGMLIVSGCISGGSDDDASEPENQAQSIEPSSSTNQSVGNASSNATYLKNTDYNETHVHDYWPGNATEKVLMDRMITANMYIQDPREAGAAIGGQYFTLPNGSFVPQGTGKLVVEVDATSALKRGEQALEYEPANAEDFTALDPQGAQATWEIEVSPQETDLPHAKATQWFFELRAAGHGSMLQGDINVKITAHKMRDLEAWPEHPDFWDGGNLTKLPVTNINATYDQLGQGGTIRIGGIYDSSEDSHLPPFPEGDIVPPETKVLLIKFWFQRSDDPKNLVNGDVRLRVKEGSSSSYYRSMWNEEIKERTGYKMYAVQVDGSSWDSPYASQSNWGFAVDAPTGLRGVPGTGDGIGLGIADAGAGNLTVDATAYRVIPPWLSDLLQGPDDEDDDDRTATVER